MAGISPAARRRMEGSSDCRATAKPAGARSPTRGIVMFVLDTNTLIYFFKGMGKVATVLLNTPPQAIAIPTIVLFELELGLAKSNHPDKRSAQLSEFLSHV